MTVGSLFSGIGGLDLGLERAGMTVRWQVENNTACRAILARNWAVPRYGDLRVFHESLQYADVIVGGDPCPSHSRARSNGASIHPDLAGYFLAVVGRLRPRWLVRENVPAPTVADFTTCLEYLGYGVVVIRCESSPLTGQLRQRDYVVAGYQASGRSVRRMFSECANGPGAYTTCIGTRPITPTLTTHRNRYDSRDCYVWEYLGGLRILGSDEREALAGFPAGWTDGFSEATRARMLGNAVVPQVAEWIGRCIMQAVGRAG